MLDQQKMIDVLVSAFKPKNDQFISIWNQLHYESLSSSIDYTLKALQDRRIPVENGKHPYYNRNNFKVSFNIKIIKI